MNVSNDLSVLILVTVPIFISVWPCLTLFWHHVIFLWIINEDGINIRNECHWRIVRPNISQCTNFYLCLTMFDTTLTPCHLLWIFNEDGINIKNECHKWIVRPNISHHNCYYWIPRPKLSRNLFFWQYIMTFRIEMVTCHLSWIFNEHDMNTSSKWLGWHH